MGDPLGLGGSQLRVAARGVVCPAWRESKECGHAQKGCATEVASGNRRSYLSARAEIPDGRMGSMHPCWKERVPLARVAPPLRASQFQSHLVDLIRFNGRGQAGGFR